MTKCIAFYLVAFYTMCQCVSAQSGDTSASSTRPLNYHKKALIYTDNFNERSKSWIMEYQESAASKISILHNRMVIDVPDGATVWLDKKLSGNIAIEYTRKVIMEKGSNDRLSDLNQFWMAGDPKNSNLFTRTGLFSQYDSLQLYYVGMGGNTNSTTRFRKYNGHGDRVLLQELNDRQHLLEPNKEYRIKIVVYNGVTQFLVNDELYFSYKDPDPLREGYFGFRTTKSKQEVGDFKIYTLE